MRKLYLNIGVMKAGTTWLYHQLANLPELTFAAEKEVLYFGGSGLLDDALRVSRSSEHLMSIRTSTDLAVIHQKLRRLAAYTASPMDDDWYRNLFLDVGDGWCADFSNTYCQLDGFEWGRVMRIADDVRASITLRSPLHRFASHVSFQSRITGEQDALPGWDAETIAGFAQHHGLVAGGKYSSIIDRLRRYVPDMPLAVLFHDDMQARPEAIMRRIATLLDLAETPPVRGRDRINASERTETMPAVREAFDMVYTQGDFDLERYGIDTPSSWRDDLFAA